jgi:glucan phosphoethanolaminetransferase (alkaline phosphatase superfamily)
MKYPIKSKYRFTGLLALIIPNLIWGFLTWTLFTATNFREHEKWNDRSLLIILLIVGSIQILLLRLLMTQFRYIVINKETIKFANPFLPFISSTYTWSDFDYFQTVEEHSKYNTHQAIWLIKDDKIKRRVSSYYYTNYGAIISSIKTPYKGKLKMNPIRQVYCLLGGRI